ncbi:hypothetical protein [Candidatus Merdisoma sp. JLR.KK006]|uniref:hypothetical protein n=1 Tax=Candidatus Merdisoma sp. JLR.KK006 TaxID=3112626 RepID=UPI002FF3D9AD
MMEKATLEKAKVIMGDNLIGSYELKRVGLFEVNDHPEIPYFVDDLETKKNDYFLILGVSKFANGKAVTIRHLKEIFGMDPNQKEPCFYNQDWYDKESFIDLPMKNEWFLIRKTVYENSRAVQPTDLMKQYTFPSAVRCTYAFFLVWLALGVKIWHHDFVWCSDTDHNGDRIYVGKYHDVDGVNKNGFSIHRHLGLRECYGCID